jgi:hypothetical protein
VPDHPDHEQLAAFQAGDGDRRQRADVEAHLAGCPSCAEVVASVELARGRLALLEEPDLPPGLHDRLAAAVEGEAAQAAADRPESGDGRSAPAEPHGRRPIPWYRRPVAWGAAAALLLAALVVPFLDRSGGDLTTAAGGAGADTAQEAATPGAAAAGLPLIRVPGEVSAAAVRSRLAADSRARAALDSAAGGQAGTPPEPSPPTASQAPDQDKGEAYRSSVQAPRAGTANLDACLPAATAAADRATRPLAPAFFVEGTYKGEEATVLVTTSTGQPGRVDLWVFPRGDCTSRPLTSDRVS